MVCAIHTLLYQTLPESREKNIFKTSRWHGSYPRKNINEQLKHKETEFGVKKSLVIIQSNSRKVKKFPQDQSFWVTKTQRGPKMAFTTVVFLHNAHCIRIQVGLGLQKAASESPMQDDNI